MAPRKNVYRVSRLLDSVSEKENNFLRGISYFKAKVRRRESLRKLRSLKVSINRNWVWVWLWYWDITVTFAFVSLQYFLNSDVYDVSICHLGVTVFQGMLLFWQLCVEHYVIYTNKTKMNKFTLSLMCCLSNCSCICY